VLLEARKKENQSFDYLTKTRELKKGRKGKAELLIFVNHQTIRGHQDLVLNWVNACAHNRMYSVKDSIK
jgi:hypothetical protein